MTVAVSLLKNAGIAFASIGPPTANGFTNFTNTWLAGRLSDPSKKPCLLAAFNVGVYHELALPTVKATYGGIACQTFIVRLAPNNTIYAADDCRFLLIVALPNFDVSKTTSSDFSIDVTPSNGVAYTSLTPWASVAGIAENVDPNFNLATAISRNYADSQISPFAMTIPPNANSPSVNVAPGGMLVSFLTMAASGVSASMLMPTPAGSTVEISNPQGGAVTISSGYLSSPGALYTPVKWFDSVDSISVVNQTVFACAFALTALQDTNLAVNCDCVDTTGYETLATLRNRLMIRLGYAAQVSNPPPGMSALLTEFLQSAQKEMYRKYAALRTKRLFRWTMTPNVVMYGLRSNDEDTICNLKLDPYKQIEWVGVQQQGNSAWTPMVEGIPPEFYTSANRSGIPTNYEIRQCIEIFPPPNAAHYLWIKGHMGLQAFSADSDTPTIDPELVFLRALAVGKAHYGKVDAIATATMADSYLKQLVAGTHGRKRYVPTVDIPGPATQPLLVLKAGQ